MLGDYKWLQKRMIIKYYFAALFMNDITFNLRTSIY